MPMVNPKSLTMVQRINLWELGGYEQVIADWKSRSTEAAAGLLSSGGCCQLGSYRLFTNMQNRGTFIMKATVLTEDLWDALDALDAVPEAQHTEWYKRLEQAAEGATQALMIEKGLITKQ